MLNVHCTLCLFDVGQIIWSIITSEALHPLGYKENCCVLRNNWKYSLGLGTSVSTEVSHFQPCVPDPTCPILLFTDCPQPGYVSMWKWASILERRALTRKYFCKNLTCLFVGIMSAWKPVVSLLIVTLLSDNYAVKWKRNMDPPTVIDLTQDSDDDADLPSQVLYTITSFPLFGAFSESIPMQESLGDSIGIILDNICGELCTRP